MYPEPGAVDPKYRAPVRLGEPRPHLGKRSADEAFSWTLLFLLRMVFPFVFWASFSLSVRF